MNEETEEIDLSYSAFLKRFKAGSIGLAKVAIGMDQAEAEQVESRRAICQSCPSGLFLNGKCDARKGGCGCLLAAKWRLAGERCPKGHW
jgi:hypothetical protein